MWQPFRLGASAAVKRFRGKKNSLSTAALKSLCGEHTRTIEPARARAAGEILLERSLSDLVNAAYGLPPDEIAILWQTAPHHRPPLLPFRQRFFALGDLW
jgi:hypothetical protein